MDAIENEGYDYDKLCNLFMWLYRRLTHYGCALRCKSGQETMFFLMFTCLRGPGSARRALAAAAYSAGLPCWSMSFLIRLCMAPMLKATDAELDFFGLKPEPRNIYTLADELSREWNKNPVSRM